jgi:predicted DNA-binding protein
MSTVLTIRLPAAKVARVARRAAELGQDRSTYIRGLIEQDLSNAPKPSKHVFASEDLAGCISTGLKIADNATVRKLIRQRLLERSEKNR